MDVAFCSHSGDQSSILTRCTKQLVESNDSYTHSILIRSLQFICIYNNPIYIRFYINQKIKFFVRENYIYIFYHIQDVFLSRVPVPISNNISRFSITKAQYFITSSHCLHCLECAFFQCLTWHSLLQYIAILHLEHRLNDVMSTSFCRVVHCVLAHATS